MIDEGTFDAGGLAGRDGLPALLFPLENASGADQLVELADAVLAWFGFYPGYQAARTVLVELLSAAVAPLGLWMRVLEAMREVRNMLQTRVEEWTEKWKQEGRLEGEQRGKKRGEQRGFQLGEQKGRPQGEAVLLLRLLERRFGVLPGWATDRVLAAESATLETRSMRVLDAASVEEILAGR